MRLITTLQRTSQLCSRLCHRDARRPSSLPADKAHLPQPLLSCCLRSSRGMQASIQDEIYSSCLSSCCSWEALRRASSPSRIILSISQLQKRPPRFRPVPLPPSFLVIARLVSNQPARSNW